MTFPGTVLISGAFGQVGKRCVELLIRRGAQVIALDIDNENTRKEAAGIRSATKNSGQLLPVYVDLLDAEALETIICRYAPAVIIHLAAIVSPPCYANPPRARRVNVEGTRNLVKAALALAESPLFVFASSSAVYGSRNPYSHRDPISLKTPVNPIECYGEDKVMGESCVVESGLPWAILRLGGIISPDGLAKVSEEYRLLVRATPGDNRLHALDVRDAALAFANAAQLPDADRNRVFLIAGDVSCQKVQRELEDDMMEVLGIGRLGAAASLPGNPVDERGWSFTDWFDTAESQRILQYQEHDWSDIKRWMAESSDARVRALLRLLGPLLRTVMRLAIRIQRRLDRRGKYADPWKLIARKYGDSVISPCDF